MSPIDLKHLFGDRHRIVLDEAAFCAGESRTDPWYFQIPCVYGHFYPHSPELIGFYCCGSNIRAKLHRDDPGLDVRQWSDDGEAVFLFTLEQFDKVAIYAKPRPKRMLSEVDKQKLIKAGSGYQFSS